MQGTDFIFGFHWLCEVVGGDQGAQLGLCRFPFSDSVTDASKRSSKIQDRPENSSGVIVKLQTMWWLHGSDRWGQVSWVWSLDGRL